MRTSTLKCSKSPRRDILEKAAENISCVDFADDPPVASSAYTTMVDGYPRPAVTVNELSQLSITGTPSRRPSVLRFSPFRNLSRGSSSGSDTQEPSTGEAAASPKTMFHATSWGMKRISVQVPEDAIDDENQDSPPPSPASDGPERRASLLRRCSDWFLKRDTCQVMEGVEGLEWTCERNDRLVTDQCQNTKALYEEQEQICADHLRSIGFTKPLNYSQ